MLFRADRQWSLQALMMRIEDLDARARSAYLELSRHYWQRGRLPAEDRDLAAICRVSVVSFRAMRVQLGWAFDELDAERRWRDHDLEAERVAAILALGRDPADFQPQPEPAAPGPGAPDRTPRSAVNRANAVAGWEKRKAQAGQEPGGVAGDATVRVASEPMRNGMRNRIAEDANGLQNRIDFASSPRVRVQDDDDDDPKESSSSSSPEGSRASGADANSHAIAHPVSHPGDAKPDATAAPAVADRPARPARAPVPTKREVLDRVTRALAGRHRPGLCSLGEIGPIMKLLHDGFDLERHVIPVLTRHTNAPLKTFAGTWIRTEAETLREADSDPDQAAPAGKPRSGKVFVQKGTPMWDAWMAYRLKVDGKPFQLGYRRGDRDGWDFDAEWPPGYEPAMAAAE